MLRNWSFELEGAETDDRERCEVSQAKYTTVTDSRSLDSSLNREMSCLTCRTRVAHIPHRFASAVSVTRLLSRRSTLDRALPIKRAEHVTPCPLAMSRGTTENPNQSVEYEGRERDKWCRVRHMNESEI